MPKKPVNTTQEEPAFLMHYVEVSEAECHEHKAHVLINCHCSHDKCVMLHKWALTRDDTLKLIADLHVLLKLPHWRDYKPSVN